MRRQFCLDAACQDADGLVSSIEMIQSIHFNRRTVLPNLFSEPSDRGSARSAGKGPGEPAAEGRVRTGGSATMKRGSVAAENEARGARSAGTAAGSCWGLSRLPYLALGGVALGLGLVGAVVPLLPTTVFLLVAVWAFARSCPYLERALLDHPRLGPPIRDWRAHRCLSRRAKRLAVVAILGSFGLSAYALDGAVLPLAALAIVLAGVAVFLLTRADCAAVVTRR
jgi:uncharacterized membrane protein YbaN (DUF454 family)